MPRLLVLLYLCLVGVPTLCFADSDEDALVLYQQARVAFNEGNLVVAKQLGKQAKALHPVDGIVVTNKRYLLKQVKYGRRTELVKELSGEENSYKPNQLLAQIKAIYKKQALTQALEAKHRQPPQLAITYSVLDDEDNDGQLSALEKGRLLLAISNRGQHTAKNVSLSVDDAQLHNLQKNPPMSLGDIEVGQTLERVIYLQPSKDNKRQRATVYATLREEDRLGELHNHPVVITTRPYFAPILTIEHLPEKSDGVIKGLSSTQFFTMKNKGADTAYDLVLAPAFERYQAFRLLKLPDLSHYAYLKASESIEFHVVLAPTQDAVEGSSLGLAFDVSARGLAANTLRSNLIMGSSAILSQQQTGGGLLPSVLKTQISAVVPSKQIVFDIANFSAATAHAKAERTVALILDLSHSKAKQGQNVAFMHTSLVQTLGIDKDNIIVLDNANLSSVKSMFSAKDNYNLVVYINAVGEYQLRRQSAYLHANGQALDLALLLQNIATLTKGNISIFIEADFAPKHQAFAQAQMPFYSQLYIQQSLLSPNKLPKHIHVIAATQASQSAHAITQHQVGAFTFALAEYLNQAPSQVQPFSEVQSIQSAFKHIQLRTNELSEYLEGVSQTPWFTSSH